MGTLTYDTVVIDIDDRALAHLQLVIISKLRRQESFLFSWTHTGAQTVGRSSIWVVPHVSLRFTFTSLTRAPMNRAWIAVLSESANSNSGLSLVPEPAPLAGTLPTADRVVTV